MFVVVYVWVTLGGVQAMHSSFFGFVVGQLWRIYGFLLFVGVDARIVYSYA